MENPKVCLMDFSDCLLLNLLKYLDSSSLYNLTKVNRRFDTLVLDSCLWKRIDARSGPESLDKNDYCLERVNKSTTMLCLRGETAAMPLMREMALDNFPDQLTVLALENQNIDENIISLNDFPKTLTELSFKNSSIANSSYFFRRTFERMDGLKVLLLDGCSLINSSVVMSVSKYPNLEVLSFYKCEIENSIPYFSIAAMHGFKKLKVLDVRLSGLGNPFLKSMIRSTNILAFYFQNMDTSYALDFKKRSDKLESQGCKTSVPEVDFKVLNTIGNDDTLITDSGTTEFKRTAPKNETFSLPDSFLYTDPYGRCTCGYMDKINESELLEPDETAHVDEEICDLLDSEPLDVHLHSVDTARDRYQIREYSAPSSKTKEQPESAKRKFDRNSRIRQPVRKRRKALAEPNNRYFPMTVMNHPGFPVRPISVIEGRLSPDIDGNRRYSSCIQVTLPPINSTRQMQPSTSNSSKASGSRASENSLSNIEVSRSGTNAAMSDSPLEDEVPRKKLRQEECESRTSSTDDGSKNTGEHNSQNEGTEPNNSRCMDIESSNSEEVKTGSSCDQDSSTVEHNGRKVMNVKHGATKVIHNHPHVGSEKRDISRTSPVPSTSEGSKCTNCGDNIADGERPSTSNGICDQAEERNDNRLEEPRTPSSPAIHVEERRDRSNQFRDPQHCPRRNIIQVYIHQANDHRNAFAPEIIRMEHGPVVLNAVRMINFIVPRAEVDNQGYRPDIEVVNVNMNAMQRSYNLALKRLSLRGYGKVTDLTLNSLEHLNLELLDLTYTKVTKRALKTFLINNPNCRVLHKDFCVCRPKLHF